VIALPLRCRAPRSPYQSSSVYINTHNIVLSHVGVVYRCPPTILRGEVKLRDGWLLGLKPSKQPYQAITSLPSSLFPICVLYLDLYLAIFYQGRCGVTRLCFVLALDRIKMFQILVCFFSRSYFGKGMLHNSLHWWNMLQIKLAASPFRLSPLYSNLSSWESIPLSRTKPRLSPAVLPFGDDYGEVPAAVA
jgi:hypothetical protein